MQQVSIDAGNDLEKSDGSKVETTVGIGSRTLVWYATKEDMDQLHRLMVARNHMTFTETLRTLMQEELERIKGK